MSTIPYDPLLMDLGALELPCGFNSCAANTDFINGPGINDPIWPYQFDSYEGGIPIIVDTDKMALFDECPDICIKDSPTGATVSLRRGVSAW